MGQQRGLFIGPRNHWLQRGGEDIDIMDVCPKRVGLFDVVLFSGMLYHVRDPIKAIQNAASVCKKHLIVETAAGLSNWKSQ